MIRVLWALILIKANAVLGARILNCPNSDVKFEKITGLPSTNASQHQLLFELTSNETERPITVDCLAMCQARKACQSFVLYYDTLKCYWYDFDVTIGNEETRLSVDNDAAWFVKNCLKTEQKFKNAWIFEAVRGATLVGNNTKTLTTNVSRSECEQKCVEERTFQCRSAKFHLPITSQHNEAVGQCTLSSTDRHLTPIAYRVSTNDDYYLEFQCAEPNNAITATNDSSYCSYEEYEDVVQLHGDLLFQNMSKESCQKQCDVYEGFNCRAYSFLNGLCILHSEDTKLRGPRVLVPRQGAFYYEKARCLNISVSCNQSYMTVRYQPETDFRGKLYMQGNSENPACYVVGQGKYTMVTLKLQLLTGQCGIVKAESPTNRTLMAGTLILQYNPIIQTQSDRILKVGCIFGNESKVLLGTGINITSNIPNKGSPLINATSNATVAPVVEMRVVDFKTQAETADSQIGQDLQLIVELKEVTDTYDLWASHLIAMTERGDESIFLLDDRGCPTNLNIFPAFQKIVTNSSRRLVATFQAFKFATSPVVRFSVIVQFCPKMCLPIKCENNVESYGRRKRGTESHILETINGKQRVQAYNPAVSSRQAETSVVNQMPLEFVMIVRDSNSRPDRLIVGNKDGKILVAGFNYSTNEVCMDFSLVIGLIVTWILVQLIFIIACIALVRRYKKHYQQEYSRASMEELHKNFGLGFSNLENRRVRWADNGEEYL